MTPVFVHIRVVAGLDSGHFLGPPDLRPMFPHPSAILDRIASGLRSARVRLCGSPMRRRAPICSGELAQILELFVGGKGFKLAPALLEHDRRALAALIEEPRQRGSLLQASSTGGPRSRALAQSRDRASFGPSNPL